MRCREDVATVVARCAGAAPPDGVREVVVREQGRGEPQWAQLEEVLQ